jgi:endonuclease YncB( thermonuclease family)
MRKNSAAVGRVPERGKRAIEHALPCEPAGAARGARDPATVLARDLFRNGPTVRIVLGDTVWLLRRTRTDRLRLTR